MLYNYIYWALASFPKTVETLCALSHLLPAFSPQKPLQIKSWAACRDLKWSALPYGAGDRRGSAPSSPTPAFCLHSQHRRLDNIAHSSLEQCLSVCTCWDMLRRKILLRKNVSHRCRITTITLFEMTFRYGLHFFFFF